MKQVILEGDECWLDTCDCFGTKQRVKVIRIHKGGNVVVDDGEFERQVGIQYLEKLTQEETT